MTLRDLAWKNIRFRLRSLFGFVFAVALGAWLYFLFASLMRDPALAEARIQTSAALGTIQFMVIAVSVITALYALTALLRGRGRELGLLQVQGMGRRDLARLLAWETLLLGVGATGLGVLMGILTGRLIYLVFSLAFALPEPLPFTFRPLVAAQTLLLFGLLFGSAGLWSAWRMGRQAVAQLMQAETRRDGVLKVSWWQVTLCVLLYGVAGHTVLGYKAGVAPERLLLLAASLALATYLFYVQGGVALLAWVRRRSFYWRGSNPILLAGLGHRLRSNARLLWLVTALAALTITMLGLITGLVLEMREGAQGSQGADIILREERRVSLKLTPEQVRNALTEGGVPPLAEAAITPRYEANEGGMGEVVLLSRSDWERWRSVEPDLPLLPETGLLVVADPVWYAGVPDGLVPSIVMERLPAPLRNEPARLEHKVVVLGLYGPGLTVVVPDQQLEAVADLRAVSLTGWRQADWFGEAQGLSEAIAKLGPMQQVEPQLLTRGGHYWKNRQGLGMLFVLFGCTGLLFFLSSGAILAFRLFTEVQADKQRFARLSQIGLSPREMNRLIRREAAILFLTPLVLAGLYAGGAIQLIGNLSKTELWPGGLIALGVYALLQLIYLRVSTLAYRRAVSQA